MSTSLLDEFLFMLFPPKCVFCKTLISKTDVCCPDCITKIPMITGGICSYCGAAMRGSSCRCTELAFKRNISPAVYDGAMRELIVHFKFKGLKTAAAPIANLMADCFERHYKNIDFDCIIPVPMHSKRLKERGYNQAKLLADELAGKVNIKTKNDILEKYRDNKIQHSLSAASRAENVKKVYRANTKVAGKTVLLVDDIFTTGSTLDACTKALLKAGAKEVYCITAARA